MKQRKSPPAPTDTNPGPTAQEWVVEALRTLAANGIDGVRVERLATALGISKGPFYWRFAGRAELLQEMLALWRSEFTTQLIERSAPLDKPRARMETLLGNVLAARWRGIDVARVEGAIRAWAAQDPLAAKAVRATDQQRIGYLVSELALLGVAAHRAETLARGIYLALLGLYTTRQYTPELADDGALRALVSLWLDQIEVSAASGVGKRKR